MTLIKGVRIPLLRGEKNSLENLSGGLTVNYRQGIVTWVRERINLVLRERCVVKDADKFTVQVRVELSEEEFEQLWRIASRYFDPRDDGSKAWNMVEKKKAIVLYSQRLITNVLPTTSKRRIE